MTLLLLVSGMLVLIALFYAKEFKTRRKGPPGPWPLPIFGNLPAYLSLLGTDSRYWIYNISKTYGEISRFRIGFRDMIFICSWESYSKLFSLSESRPKVEIFYERNLKMNSGLSFSNGKHWAETKAWTVKTLKELGFFKISILEPQILEEVDLVLKKIENSSLGGSVMLEMNQLFAAPVTKVMWKLIYGCWKPEHEPQLAKVVESSYTFLSQGILAPGIINAFPILKQMFPNALGLSVTNALTANCREIARELLQETEKRMEKKEVGTPGSVVEAFVKSLKETSGRDPLFTTMNFETIFMDLLQGTADPVNQLLERLILFMALYPASQEKVYQEIQNTFKENDEDKSISFGSCKRMNYTQAVILEMHRHVPVNQQNVRMITQDVYYKQYLIPKGSELTCDLIAIYKNLNIWGPDPEHFRPERFLNEKGHLFNQQYLSPFGIGKRACPGRNVGEMTTFLFFISIMKNYQVSLVPGDKRPQEFPKTSLITMTHPYRVIFTKR